MENETKYIVKAFDYDGNFYGYAAKHPEEDDMPYYDDDKSAAIRFDTYSDADNWIEKYSDSSELEFIIANDYPNEAGLEEVIYQWVGENYGAEEVNNPSWNVEALANTIEEFLKNKGA